MILEEIKMKDGVAMRTLLIISHPSIADSHTQRFLWESLPEEGVSWHHLEKEYPSNQIDIQKEQTLLLEHDRILFQFPLYWYSSPPLLKQWQDEVLTEGFAYGKTGNLLTGKEFGLIVTTGVHERAYQAGREEKFTIPELMRPFEAVANKCGMIYLPVLLLARFDYLSESEKKALLIRYRQYLTNQNDDSLVAREQWFKQELRTYGKKDFSEEDQQLIELLIEQMEENREQLDDLLFTLQELEEL